MSPVYIVFLLSLSLTSALKRSCEAEDKETLKCNYLPNKISGEISRVRIVDFIGPNETVVMNITDFNSQGWRSVKYLEISNSLPYSDLKFTAETFSNLKRLNELQLHLDHFFLDPDTFVGLNSVKSLDVSNCFRVSFGDLLQSLNGTDKLPGLAKLTMSRLNEYHRPNVIDESFGQTLQQKVLKYLDMSKTAITTLHLVVFKYLRHLQFVNVSSATFGDTFKDNFELSDLKNIDFDLSHAILPPRPPPGNLILSNVVVKNPTVHTMYPLAFIEAKIVNMSSLVPTLTSIWIHNTTIIIDKPVHILIQRLIAKNNNLRYLDIHVDYFCNKCSASNVEKVDFSHNALQFINPSMANFAPNIKILDLSFNQLFKMAKHNGSMFEILLNQLSYLQSIFLSTNNLNTIPVNMFDTNVDLEVIDLSNNKLRQVTFLLTHLKKLQVLDVRNNLIHSLDESSISHLDSVCHTSRYDDSYPTIILEGNNLSCSTCDAKTFIKWLLDTKMVNITSQNLTCKGKDGTLIAIGQSTLDLLHNVCYFVLYNVIICLSVAFISVVTAVASVKACKMWHRIEVIKRLQEGYEQYKYVALLVSHEDDGMFVQDNIAGPLETEIRTVTNIRNRNLIMESEKVDPGHSVGTALYNVINETSVVIAIVSRAFCEDPRCSSVMDGARDIGKPILLFHIEGSIINRGDMTPVMKQLLRIRPKIVWKVENDQRIMQTSWENVCNTILDYTE